MAKEKKLKVTLVRSPIGRKTNHQQCVKGLGLRKMNSSVEVQDTPENRGMLNRIDYMVRVEEV